MGTQALLVIDGVPRVLRAGSQAGAVKVISVSGDAAEVEVDGHRQRLVVGSAARVGAPARSAAGAGPVVLRVGPNGLYPLEVRVQGKGIQGVVDTGATLVALPARMAPSLGLMGAGGPSVQLQTAAGPTRGKRVVIPEMQVGEHVVHNVDAVLVEGDLPTVLWGHSLLKSFNAQTQSGRMTLTPSTPAPSPAGTTATVEGSRQG